MKVNPEIRHQDLALHVSDQLDFISVSDVRALHNDNESYYV